MPKPNEKEGEAPPSNREHGSDLAKLFEEIDEEGKPPVEEPPPNSD
jgi:hypothetical protein